MISLNSLCECLTVYPMPKYVWFKFAGFCEGPASCHGLALCLHNVIMFGFYRSDDWFKTKNRSCILYSLTDVGSRPLSIIACAPLSSKCHLMFDGQSFGILGALHWSKLLYGKIRTDHINGNKPYGPYNQNPNRAEWEKIPKMPNYTGLA